MKIIRFVLLIFGLYISACTLSASVKYHISSFQPAIEYIADFDKVSVLFSPQNFVLGETAKSDTIYFYTQAGCPKGQSLFASGISGNAFTFPQIADGTYELYYNVTRQGKYSQCSSSPWNIKYSSLSVSFSAANILPGESINYQIQGGIPPYSVNYSGAKGSLDLQLQTWTANLSESALDEEVISVTDANGVTIEKKLSVSRFKSLARPYQKYLPASTFGNSMAITPSGNIIIGGFTDYYSDKDVNKRKWMILRSTDGGASFARTDDLNDNSGLDWSQVTDIYSNNLGTFATGYYLKNNINFLIIRKSTDEGLTWNTVFEYQHEVSGDKKTINIGLSLASDGTDLWALGGSFTNQSGTDTYIYVLKSTDNGNSWTKTYSASSLWGPWIDYLTGSKLIYTSDALYLGISKNSNSAYLYKSVDKGTSFQTRISSGLYYTILDFAVNGTKLCILSYNKYSSSAKNRLTCSSNEGTNKSSIDTDTTTNWTNYGFIDNLVAFGSDFLFFTGSSDGVLKTLNLQSDLTTTEISSQSNYSADKIFIHGSDIYRVLNKYGNGFPENGSSSVVLEKSTNSGVNWGILSQTQAKENQYFEVSKIIPNLSSSNFTEVGLIASSYRDHVRKLNPFSSVIVPADHSLLSSFGYGNVPISIKMDTENIELNNISRYYQSRYYDFNNKRYYETSLGKTISLYQIIDDQNLPSLVSAVDITGIFLNSLPASLNTVQYNNQIFRAYTDHYNDQNEPDANQYRSCRVWTASSPDGVYTNVFTETMSPNGDSYHMYVYKGTQCKLVSTNNELFLIYDSFMNTETGLFIHKWNSTTSQFDRVYNIPLGTDSIVGRSVGNCKSSSNEMLCAVDVDSASSHFLKYQFQTGAGSALVSPNTSETIKDFIYSAETFGWLAISQKRNYPYETQVYFLKDGSSSWIAFENFAKPINFYEHGADIYLTSELGKFKLIK